VLHLPQRAHVAQEQAASQRGRLYRVGTKAQILQVTGKLNFSLKKFMAKLVELFPDIYLSKT